MPFKPGDDIFKSEKGNRYLGIEMFVIRDAIISFPLELSGMQAQTVLDVTLGLLSDEFAQLVSTKDL